MNRRTEQPTMPGTNPDADTVAALRKHMSDAQAEVLARRLESADEDAKTASPWPVVKARILKTPLPR